MSLRFAALLTAVAGLLGVMVTVVAGHIVAARKDWAVYQSLPEATAFDVSVWTVNGTEPLTYAYLTALLLVLGTVVLLCTSWGASNRRRFMVNRMFGAHPGSYARHLLVRVAPGVAVGTAIGIAAGWAALVSLAALSEVPGLATLSMAWAVNLIAVSAVFALTIAIQAHRWTRS